MYIVAGAREGLSQKKVEGKDQHQKLTFELHTYVCRHTRMHTHTHTHGVDGVVIYSQEVDLCCFFPVLQTQNVLPIMYPF